jgi:hypothetical protein
VSVPPAARLFEINWVPTFNASTRIGKMNVITQKERFPIVAANSCPMTKKMFFIAFP